LHQFFGVKAARFQTEILANRKQGIGKPDACFLQIKRLHCGVSFHHRGATMQQQQMVYVLHLPRQLDDGFRGLTWAKRLFPEANEKLVSLSLVGAKLDFDIPS
jgi:hypothetical protein